MDLYLEVRYQKPIEDWDLEELARGRPRDKNGKFQGMTPKWISPTVQKEARRRLLEHAFGTMAGHVDTAITTLINLIKSEDVDDKGKPIVDARTKLQACIFILEHIMGKPKAVVELTDTNEAKSALAAAIVLDDGQPKNPPIVLEGEFTDDDDTEEEEDDA